MQGTAEHPVVLLLEASVGDAAHHHALFSWMRQPQIQREPNQVVEVRDAEASLAVWWFDFLVQLW